MTREASVSPVATSTNAVRSSPLLASARDAIENAATVRLAGDSAFVAAAEECRRSGMSASRRKADRAVEITVRPSDLCMAERTDRGATLSALANVPLTCACPTVPLRALLSPGVLGRPGVAAGTHVGLAQPLRGRDAAGGEGVLTRRQQPQVLRVDASPVTAGVVDHASGVERADETAVGPAVGALLALDMEPPVSSWVDVAGPPPAAIALFLDLRPETFLGVHGGSIRV